MKNKHFYKSGKFKNEYLENLFLSFHNTKKSLLLFSRNGYTYEIIIPFHIYKKFWLFDRVTYIYRYIGPKNEIKIKTIAKVIEYKN